MGKWTYAAARMRPEQLIETFLALGDDERWAARGPAAEPRLSEAERFGVHWLWGACGLGTFGMDRLLTALACLLDYGAVVLAASSNDNGLLHQEMVDFELPEGLGWGHGPPPRGEASAST